VNSLFEKGKRHVLNYADRQKTYIQDREAEFRDIIDILTRAMVILDSDNRTFNRQILEQSDRIERISRLDDIKKIKQALLEGVEEIRQTARNKQSRDMDKLASLSEQVQVLHHQLEEARRESERDGLTGIYNRKAFDEYLSGLVEKNTVVKQPFALLMLDIDNFKAINDTHGHQVGDRVILAVVNKCRQYIRSEDYLARYGGEEFAAVLPGASLKNAWKKADLIRSAIGATRYVIEGMHEENAIAVTVSGGVSVYRKADSRETVTRRADQALYVAKLSGKNCIVSEKDASGKNFPPVTATG
jgi:diguanylate cyclase